ncbi:glutamate-1-semialdehyde 2,1-aminomutase [Calditrichota bacterium]
MLEPNRKLFESALKVIPGGVNSPVRSFGSVGGVPRFIKSAKGCFLTDVEGREYIDYIGAWGPMILGHNHPVVTEALINALQNGIIFGTPCEAEILLAEEIINRVDSVEMVRFVNSGTEATMNAVRLARAATRRDIIVRFAGGYHGHADVFLVSAGSGALTLGKPDSAGVTHGSIKDTRIVQYNDLHAVQQVFQDEGDQIAGIIIEPIAGNMGVVLPEYGFITGLRDICDRYEAMLIFDEVMTGFRVARGGAQELVGIRPDISVFGKIIGGGLPVGAYGASMEIMSHVSPEGEMYQAGTFSGNPLTMAAGLATLKQLDDKAYSYLENQSLKLEAGLNKAAEKVGVPVITQRCGSMLTVFFSENKIRNLADASNAEHNKFKNFFHSMLVQGVHLPPSGYESWFLSLAHEDEVIEKTIEDSNKAFAAAEQKTN